jgi:cobyrinic acid a,c-diamide synthase
MDRIPNETVLKKCNTSRVSCIVQYRRLRWLGHVAKMEDERLPTRHLGKMMMFSTLEGAGKRINCKILECLKMASSTKLGRAIGMLRSDWLKSDSW